VAITTEDEIQVYLCTKNRAIQTEREIEELQHVSADDLVEWNRPLQIAVHLDKNDSAEILALVLQKLEDRHESLCAEIEEMLR
jgi:hypothetical protein